MTLKIGIDMPKQLILKTTCALIIITCAWCLVGCFNLAGDWEFKEVGRIKSPDGQVEALIVNGEAGATTSLETLVLIVEPGRQVKTQKLLNSEAMFRASHLKNFKVVWKQPKLLEIQYDEARIDHFGNLWENWQGHDTSYTVEIRLNPTSPTFSVPLKDRIWR
jgi:hypothetical protein